MIIIIIIIIIVIIIITKVNQSLPENESYCITKQFVCVHKKIPQSLANIDPLGLFIIVWVKLLLHVAPLCNTLGN